MSAALRMFADRPEGWSGAPLRSPVTRQTLAPHGANHLVAAGEAWPIIDSIPYLSAGRKDVAARALAAIDAGELDEAAVILIAGDTSAEPSEQLRTLVGRRDELSFRDAMRALGYGPLADELAHRWSDPGFLAGLALAEAYWLPRGRVVEIGCGAGHFVRAFLKAAPSVIGADRAFSRLWLARHWVCPAAELVCFDMTDNWPLGDASADLLFCGDVPETLTDLGRGVAELHRVAGPDGAILCGQFRRDAAGAALFEQATAFSEAELTAALIARRAPRARDGASPSLGARYALAAGSAAKSRPATVSGLLDAPARGTPLRRNPVYCEQGDGVCVRRFPSSQYAEKFGTRVTYPSRVAARSRVIAGADPADDSLIRRRVWVDLPARW